jgi:hypothetical protein
MLAVLNRHPLLLFVIAEKIRCYRYSVVRIEVLVLQSTPQAAEGRRIQLNA